MLNRFRISIIFFVLTVVGCSSRTHEQTWDYITDNGDKPGIAIVLVEKENKVTRGKYYILDPNYPRDLSKGLAYPAKNLKYIDNTVTFDVTLIDMQSSTKTKNLSFTIKIKGKFQHHILPAELQQTDSANNDIVFNLRKNK
jgi:hypothetical protein